MALAVFQFEEASGDNIRFHVDIGHNHFYQYKIGNNESQNSGGFATLANPIHESEIFGPLSSSLLGRTNIDIPLALFGRNARFAQLVSYRKLPNTGAAISDIVEVPFAVIQFTNAQDEERKYDLGKEIQPKLHLRPLDHRKGMPAMQHHLQRNPINVHVSDGEYEYGKALGYTEGLSSSGDVLYAAPFTYQESKYSDAMFLEAIGSLLSSALPIVNQVIGGSGGVANILGSLLGGASSSPPSPPNPSGANPQSVTPDLARQIVDLIKLLSNPQQAITPQTSPAIVPQQVLAKSYSDAGYSQQMIAPALLAALPALLPLLEKVMNPQTINAVLSNVGPKATIGAVADAIKDIGSLNIQAYQNILDHIQKNMPSSDTTPLLNHLLAITESLSIPTILPSYRRIETVQIDFITQTLVTLRGREQLIYHADAPQGLVFPLTVQTPRPIRNATLYLLVKEVETLRVVVEKQWDVSDISTGILSEAPRLSQSEIGGLLPGNEYLVCSYLIWKTKQGESIGTSRTQSVQIMREYVYQGVEAGGEIVPLNDVDKFRPYWHKIWQESFTREKRRWEWDCKYYYTLHTEGGKSERLETMTEEIPGAGRRIEGRIKSGLRLSVSDLNSLLPEISSYSQLNAHQLEALSVTSVMAAFGRAARSKVQFRGAIGDSVALWIYPEMRLQPVILLRAGTPDMNGLITTLSEETVHFPIPSLAHFVGVTTETNPYPALDEGEEI
jgi:hypothetical protein